MTQEKKISDFTSFEELKEEAMKIMGKTLSQEQMTRQFGFKGPGDKRSRDVLDNIFFKQQIIQDIEPKTDIELFDQKLKTPIMIAPMASMATMFEDGIGKMCAATREVGSMTWVAFYSKEHYGKHVKTNPLVFIMKPVADREKLLNELKIADAEGCVALGIDVDSGGETMFRMGAGGRWGFEKPLSINELKKIRESVSKPFVIKGILSVDDALKAVEVGADAIVVSNHYGMKIDYCQAPLEVLPSIVEAVGEKIEVLVDCQIRTGSDVLKALALGGKGVLLGRPIYWAARVGGTEGITQLLRVITTELKKIMVYTGIENVRKVPRDTLILPRTFF